MFECDGFKAKTSDELNSYANRRALRRNESRMLSTSGAATSSLGDPVCQTPLNVENAEVTQNRPDVVSYRLAASRGERTAAKGSTMEPELVHSAWLGEFLGTFILILLGNGVNASVSLRKTYAENAGWMVVTTGWGIAVLCGVLTAQAFGSPGAHLNPAISLSAAVISGDFSHLASFWSAQLLGAMTGATLTWLFFYPHWKVTPEPGTKLGVFCTGPAIPHLPSNLLGEATGTFVLVLVAGAIFSHGVSASGPAPALGPWLVASLVWGIGLSLGSTTGYAINPARDLGPRLVHFLLPIAGKGPSNWRYAPIPIVGDLAGAALAGLLLRFAHL